jgi:hypothetical protein
VFGLVFGFDVFHVPNIPQVIPLSILTFLVVSNTYVGLRTSNIFRGLMGAPLQRVNILFFSAKRDVVVVIR